MGKKPTRRISKPKATKPAKKKTARGTRKTPTKTAKASETKRRHAQRIHKELERLYPNANCALTHRNPYELLVATILSAQCTDVRVNMVTPDLFKRYPTPAAMAEAPIGDIEQAVRTTGFYRNKAKNIRGTSQQLVEKHDGNVPDTMEELLELPGVARKTANVVLGNAFDKNEGVVVDTHVGRLSRRLGLTKHTDPKKVELDLMALFPSHRWAMLAHLLIHHGRAVCPARKPKCNACTLTKICPKAGIETKT